MTRLEILKELCKGRDITINRLEQELGFSQGALGKINSSMPKADKLQALAQYFHVPMEILLSEDVDAETLNKFKEFPDWNDILSCFQDSSQMPPSFTPISQEEPVYDVAAGPGCVNGDYTDNYVNTEEEEMNEYTWCEVHGDSMLPTLMSGDLVKVHIQTETDPHDLTVIKVDGESATIKHVEIVSDGIWLRADNKEVFPDKFYTVQEVLTLPITIIGKAVEFKRAL